MRAPLYLTLFTCLYFVCLSYLAVCVHVCHVHVVPLGEKKVLDPMELELQAIVSSHTGTGN